MAQKYSYYQTRYLEESTKDGLGYTVRHLLSLFPASLGHLIDVILGLDGTLGGKDKSVNFHGPFGLLLGLPFFLVGSLIGTALQFLITLPSVLVHQLVDKPIGILIYDYIGYEEIRFEKWMVDVPFLNLLSVALTILTQATNKELHGPFGFIVGFIPEIARYWTQRTAGMLISVTRLITDTICDFIRNPVIPISPPPVATEQNTQSNHIQFEIGKNALAITNDMIRSRIDLFQALGISTNVHITITDTLGQQYLHPTYVMYYYKFHFINDKNQKLSSTHQLSNKTHWIFCDDLEEKYPDIQKHSYPIEPKEQQFITNFINHIPTFIAPEKIEELYHHKTQLLHPDKIALRNDLTPEEKQEITDEFCLITNAKKILTHPELSAYYTRELTAAKLTNQPFTFFSKYKANMAPQAPEASPSISLNNID